jgi:hypothetical protein
MKTEKNQSVPKLPKLTKKQRGFVNDYVETENGAQSILKNYNIDSKHGTNNPTKVATVMAVENLAKPSIINAIEVKRKSLKQALIDKGIDENKIADKINVLLEATIGDNPDVNAIDKGLRHTTNIFGVEDPGDKPKQNVYNNFFFSSEIQEKVKVMEDEIKKALVKKNVQEN